MTPPPAQHLIDHVQDLLRRVVEVPVAAKQARAAAAEVERSWKHKPLVSAVAGEDVRARTALLNYLAGDRWLSESRREAKAALLLLRRGAGTSYEVQRRGGVREQYSLEDADPAEGGGRSSWADELRAEVAERERGLERAHSALPRPLRHRPPIWALWLWLLRWLLMLAAKRKRIAFAKSARDLGEARARLEAVEKSAAAATRSSAERRRRFVKEVRALTDGAQGGADLDRLVVEVAEAPLPLGVEVIDLPLGAAPDHRGHQADACMLVCEGGEPLGERAGAFADAAEAAGSRLFVVTESGEVPASVRPGTLRCVGGFAEAAAALAPILLHERALHLGRLAEAPLCEAMASLKEKLSRAEASFEERIEKLEARRIDDPEAFRRSQLARVRPLISQRIHLLIEQATMELSSALARSGQEWLDALDEASTMDDLRHVIARIDEESPRSLEAARDHCRSLARASLSSAARDLYDELMAEFRELAPLSPDEGEPAPRDVELMSSLSAEESGTRLKGPGSRLASLFRSLDRVKAEVRGRLEERVTRLRKLATAELLDAEQPLYQALLDPLASALETALETHTTRLAEALRNEREEIAAERAALAPLRDLHEKLAEDQRRLRELLKESEEALPG